MRIRAVLTAVTVVGLVLGGCGDDGDETEVFSFSTSDVCEWVSDAEVAEFVAAEFDWDGTATQAEPFPAEACRWELSGADDPSGYVFVSDTGQWEYFSGRPYDLDAVMEAEGVVDYQGEPVGIGQFVAAHPALSDGVVVHNGGFGQYAFAVPPDTEWLQLGLEVPGADPPGSEDYEDQYFAVVDHFLEDLGWLSAA